MPLETLLLKTGSVSTSSPTSPVYSPASTAPKKAAIVEGMRFTNTGSGTSKLRVWFQKAGGNMGSTARRILPYDQPIPVGFTLIEDAELTLDSGDGLYFQIDTGTVEFALCGSERPLS